MGTQVGTFSSSTAGHAALWYGSPLSIINLNPSGSSGSTAIASFGSKQVGIASINGFTLASLWNGSASSWTNLSPPNCSGAAAHGVYEDFQVGLAYFSGGSHASLWSGSAATWEDLSLALSGAWKNSEARSVWSDGETLVGLALSILQLHVTLIAMRQALSGSMTSSAFKRSSRSPHRRQIATATSCSQSTTSFVSRISLQSVVSNRKVVPTTLRFHDDAPLRPLADLRLC